MKFDAKFHAFMEIGKVLSAVLPVGAQLTKEQADLVHATADKLARELTSGEFVYEP